MLRAFPTYVGMNRLGVILIARLKRVPHIRGDEPLPEKILNGDIERSPHTWG